MRRLILPVFFLSTFIITACGESPTPPEVSSSDLSLQAARGPGGSKVKFIAVAPSSVTVLVGQTTQLTAATRPPNVSVLWTTADPAIATVSQSGVVTGVGAGITTIAASAGGKADSSTITVTATSGSFETFVGAGDIAYCLSTGDEATADLLDAIPGTVFTLGDNAYTNGTAQEFTDCYSPTRGRHKDRTKPSPGNHDYNTLGATGYYGYFGAAAGDPSTGYYSYNLGDWHVIALNSNLPQDPGSAQDTWLRADLAANTKSCTLAYWHHPRFSSGAEHGDDVTIAPFWNALYEANADVILSGHDHDYERFAPQTPAGVADASRGIREFIVGTGGRSHYALGTLKANSEVFNGTTYGVLKLTLSQGSYSWQFVPIAVEIVTDSGSGTCH